MLRLFLTFIKEYGLVSPSDHLLLGVSGGVDSMVLLDLMSRGGFSFGVAHVNYRLRGAESDKDAELVKQVCKDREVEFHLMEVDTVQYDSHESVQMVARTIRYDFFLKLQEQHGYTKVVTAHQATDNIETVLFNLTKGTGIAGLTGISLNRDRIIRPLLPFSREAIFQYAANEKLTWREDASNEKIQYHRNRIRNRVLPELRRINPSLEDTFQDTLIRICGAADLTEQRKNEILRQYSKKSGSGVELKMDWFSGDFAGMTLLSEILKPYGYHFRSVKELSQAMLNGHSGAVFYSNSFEVVVDRKRILIDERRVQDPVSYLVHANEQKLITPFLTLHFKTVPGNQWQDVASDWSVSLDADLLIYPFTVRNWREGDVFVPLGMTGRKKISDFLIDCKIPVSEKRKILVLESGGEILWLIGFRMDNRFKVTQQTRHMLTIKAIR